MVDLAELLHKNRGHFLGNVPDDALQLPLGGEHIVPLPGQILVALVDPGVFVDGSQVGGAQAGDLPLQLSDAPVSRRHGFDLPPLFSGGAGGQAVVVPELVNDLLFLHGGGDLLLL